MPLFKVNYLIRLEMDIKRTSLGSGHKCFSLNLVIKIYLFRIFTMNTHERKHTHYIYIIIYLFMLMLRKNLAIFV